ncbi:MAG: hypothetical protein GYA57_22180 [Myxococcales bacterium]|nr:hypothetical protein [Myxococcales bacterium]
MKSIFAALIVISLAGTAGASSSYFYGTNNADTIIVGRAFNGGGLVYMACINNVWEVGGIVTGSSDTISVSANGGNDVVTVRATNDLYNCGGYVKWFYRLDYYSSCPGAVYLSGNPGNDIITGGQCVERLYGGDGNDTLRGGAGYDYIEASPGDDCIDDLSVSNLLCGAGYDRYTPGGSWGDCEELVKMCPDL